MKGRHLRLLVTLLIACVLAAGSAGSHLQASPLADARGAIIDHGACHGDPGPAKSSLPELGLALCCSAHIGAPPPSAAAPSRATLPVAQHYVMDRQTSPTPPFILPDPRPPRG